ncbi:hypothetical protein EX895_000459 [Sporisorium graminicola]|uniref:Uncharacterized protein n=1 Tax=Sporisorium graminicola TaxID=280036 RepID=A0A4U7KZV9_9BASI|nr:hypothetical protein EX895_000459 [Sporisorium graminicola]TKY90461.1 hypothetical protein EX895_000459 [Sporisorium graminicola]
MGPSLAASSLLRRGRSITSGSNDLGDSSTSSRRQSGSSSSRKPSRSSFQMDDWTDGFTGIVDLDRRMRELAMSEQGFSALDSSNGLDVYEPYSPPSFAWSEKQQPRKNSSSGSRPGSASHSSMATGRSNPSLTSNLNMASCSSTTATSRFSQDSRAHSSLLSKRRSSTTNTIDSVESAHSPLRLAPLPASPSAFGNYRLTDASACPPSRSSQLSGTSLPLSWSSLDDQDPLTTHAATENQLEPLTPGTAAAATWTDPSAPRYFPAGLSGEYSKKGARSQRKKTVRAPLPRLISGEVVSSSIDESGQPRLHGKLFDKETQQLHAHAITSDLERDAFEGKDGPSASHSSTEALKKSAQSLALNLRFKIIRAKRKVNRSREGAAADLFASAHTSSQRSSVEASLST